MSDNFTQEDVKDLLQRVNQLESENAELKQASDDAAIQGRIDEAIAEAKAELADVQQQLDVATAEVEALKAEIAERDEAAAEAERQAEETARLEEVKATRAAEVAELTSFGEEHIADRIDRWAGLDDEAWDALKADWAEVAKATKSDDSADGSDSSFNQTVETASKTENTEIPAVNLVGHLRSSCHRFPYRIGRGYLGVSGVERCT